MKRAIRWPNASIHTAASLQRSHRQLSRRSAGATQVLGAMKRGATLHLHYQDGRPIWRLSSGPFVTPEAAAIVTAATGVVGVGDSLFPGHPGHDRIDQAIRELHAIRAEVVALLPPPPAEGNGLNGADDFTPDNLIEISTAVERFNRPADSLRWLCRHEACGRKIAGRWMASVPRLRRRLRRE